MSLIDLHPIKTERVMTLVEKAGVDVSDWSNFSGGKEKAASNPKYCYEWSFLQPGKVAVLNLWYSELNEKDGIIFQNLNLRKRADSYEGSDPRKRRAKKMDNIIQIASGEGLPIRVVVGFGRIRDPKDPFAKASRMNKRLLDTEFWHIASYDGSTGDCLLVRGSPAEKLVDQFSIEEVRSREVKKVSITSEVFIRSSEVRRNVLVRANGRCEFCQSRGFRTADGAIFLETHHVIPLAEGGPDIEKNVVAICPNHHRESHYGEEATQIRDYLLNYLSKIPLTRPFPARS